MVLTLENVGSVFVDVSNHARITNMCIYYNPGLIGAGLYITTLKTSVQTGGILGECTQNSKM